MSGRRRRCDGQIGWGCGLGERSASTRARRARVGGFAAVGGQARWVPGKNRRGGPRTFSSRSILRDLRPSSWLCRPSTTSSAVVLISSTAASNFCTFFLCSSSMNLMVSSASFWVFRQRLSNHPLFSSGFAPPSAGVAGFAGESGVGPGSPGFRWRSRGGFAPPRRSRPECPRAPTSPRQRKTDARARWGVEVGASSRRIRHFLETTRVSSNCGNLCLNSDYFSLDWLLAVLTWRGSSSWASWRASTPCSPPCPPYASPASPLLPLLLLPVPALRTATGSHNRSPPPRWPVAAASPPQAAPRLSASGLLGRSRSCASAARPAPS